VILINLWEGEDPRKRALDYCERWDVDGTVLLDEDGAYAGLLGVRGVPTNVVVDASGTVRAFGAGNPEELDASVDELLRDPPQR
jgi:hypothetical protein